MQIEKKSCSFVEHKYVIMQVSWMVVSACAVIYGRGHCQYVLLISRIRNPCETWIAISLFEPCCRSVHNGLSGEKIMVFLQCCEKNSRPCKMDSRLTLLNNYHFGVKRRHYKLPEHHLRNFEKMAIIEQAVNNQMYDKNQEQQIIKYKCMVS